MPKRALFVVSTRGQGHIVRCRALAAELATRGWASTMTNKAPLSPASYDVSIVDLEGEDHEHDVYEVLKDRPVVAIVDTHFDLPAVNLVVCGNAGARTVRSRRCLFGPRYALLRPEFLQARIEDTWQREHRPTNGLSFDCRKVSDLSAATLAERMRDSDEVVTWGGMRALEAACVRGNAVEIHIRPRNEGEIWNMRGLYADPTADLVDGRGCLRVADAILELAG